MKIHWEYLRMPVLLRTLFLLISIELLVVVAPFIIPQNYYLKLYLDDKSLRSTESFLNGDSYLIPDLNTGWRNKPSVIRKKWLTDEYGSRANQEVTLEKRKFTRVMFLGSSMINGGTQVRNDETISAYLENENIEALNFGTMLYGLDQAYIAFESDLNKFRPDIVIFGLDSDPISALLNMYVPFRNPNETNMPFLKPRYDNRNSDLDLININPTALETILTGEDTLELLEEHDLFQVRFKRYQHIGLTPIASVINYLFGKWDSFKYYQDNNSSNKALLQSLMHEIEDSLTQVGYSVVFLSMPAKSDLVPGKLSRLFPDRYAARMQSYRDSGFEVIDVKDIFLESEIPLNDLYHEDKLHFRPKANRIIAKKMKEILFTSSN